jgi:hypothetical protein
MAEVLLAVIDPNHVLKLLDAWGKRAISALHQARKRRMDVISGVLASITLLSRPCVWQRAASTGILVQETETHFKSAASGDFAIRAFSCR